MIDSLREQIHHRIKELEEEIGRLRQAHTALGPGSTPSPERATSTRRRTARKPRARKAATAPRARKPRAARATKTTTATPARTAAVKTATTNVARRGARKAAAGAARSGTAPGATRSAVLGALGPEPLTAGQVAEKVGLARPTVATTLSRLAKSGQVQKADRGYRLTPPA